MTKRPLFSRVLGVIVGIMFIATGILNATVGFWPGTVVGTMVGLACLVAAWVGPLPAEADVGDSPLPKLLVDLVQNDQNLVNQVLNQASQGGVVRHEQSNDAPFLYIDLENPKIEYGFFCVHCGTDATDSCRTLLHPVAEVLF